MPDITIKLDQDKFNSLLVNGAFMGVSYEIKDVTINDDLFKNESADLLFHLLVLFAEKDISLNEVVDVLKIRHQ